MAWSYIQYPVMNHNGKCLKCVHTHTPESLRSTAVNLHTRGRPREAQPPSPAQFHFFRNEKCLEKGNN